MIQAYRTVFWGYAAFGVIKFLLSIALSKNVEAEKELVPAQDPETAPLLGDGADEVEPKKSTFRSLLPKISAESRVIVFNLVIMMALDAFASGLTPM